MNIYYLGNGSTFEDSDGVTLLNLRDVDQGEFDKLYSDIIAREPEAVIERIADILCEEQGFCRPVNIIGVNTGVVEARNKNQLTQCFLYAGASFRINADIEGGNTGVNFITNLLSQLKGLPVFKEDNLGNLYFIIINNNPHIIIEYITTQYVAKDILRTAKKLEQPVVRFQGELEWRNGNVTTTIQCETHIS